MLFPERPGGAGGDGGGTRRGRARATTVGICLRRRRNLLIGARDTLVGVGDGATLAAYVPWRWSCARSPTRGDGVAVGRVRGSWSCAGRCCAGGCARDAWMVTAPPPMTPAGAGSPAHRGHLWGVERSSLGVVERSRAPSGRMPCPFDVGHDPRGQPFLGWQRRPVGQEDPIMANRCTQCGRELSSTDRFCIACGSPCRDALHRTLGRRGRHAARRSSTSDRHRAPGREHGEPGGHGSRAASAPAPHIPGHARGIPGRARTRGRHWVRAVDPLGAPEGGAHDRRATTL